MAPYLLGAAGASPRTEVVLAAGNSGSTISYVEAVIRG